MKRTLLFLFSLMTVVFSYAIDCPLNVTVDTPADRTEMEEAQTFTLDLSFGGQAAGNTPLVNSLIKPYVTNGSDNFEGTLVSNGKNYTLTFDPAITTPGTYSLVLPKGAVHAFSTTHPSIEYTLEDFFTIKGGGDEPTPVGILPWDYISYGDEFIGASDGLSAVSISLPSEVFVGYPWDYEDTVIKEGYKAVLKHNGNEIASYNIEVNPSDPYGIQIDVTTEGFAEGNYTLEIPAGVAVSEGNNLESEALSLNCVVKASEVAVDLSYTVEPAEGSEIELPKVVDFTFADNIFIGLTGDATGAFSVLDVSGNVVTHVNAIEYGSNVIGVDFKAEGLASGKYTLELPKDGYMFVVNGDFDNMIEPTGALRVSYEIKAAAPVDFSYILEPAVGSELTLPATVIMKYPDSRIQVCPYGSASLQNAAGEEVMEVELDDYDYNNELVINIPEAKLATGTYYLVIPAELLDIIAGEEARTNEEEYRFEYVIKGEDPAPETMEVAFEYRVYYDEYGNYKYVEKEESFEKVYDIGIDVPFSGYSNPWTWNQSLRDQIVLSDGTTEYRPVSCVEENPLPTYAPKGYKRLRCTFDSTIATPGTYTLTLPEGLVEQDGKVNAAYTLPYPFIIVAQNVKPDFSGAYFSTPSENVVTSITEVAVTFPNLAEGLEPTLTDYMPIDVKYTDENGNSGSEWATNIRLEGNRLIGNVNIVKEGKYELHLWANAFGSGSNEELTKTVTVEIPSIFKNTEDFVFNPAAGEVTEISSVKFSIKGQDVYDAANPHLAYIKNNDTGVTTTCSRYDLAQDWSYIEFVFNPAITEAGNYTFIIPANAVCDGKDNTDYNRSDISVDYIITKPEPSIFDDTEDFVFDPEAGEVGMISSVTFSVKNKDVVDAENPYKVYIRNNETGEEIMSSGWETPVDSEGWFNVKFTFNPAITEAGSYTFVIPENAVCEWNTDDYNKKEITVDYTVDPSLAVVPDYWAGIEMMEPAPGVVEALPGVDLDYFTLALTNHGDNQIEGLENYTNIKVESTSGETLTFTMPQFFSRWGYFYLNVEKPVTAPGVYTITIPEGTFTIGGQGNPELVYKYIIEGAPVADTMNVDYSFTFTDESGKSYYDYETNEVPSLKSMRIKVPFGRDDERWIWNEELLDKIVLSNGDTEFIPTKCDQEMLVMNGYVPVGQQALRIVFEEALTEGGNYTLTLPEGLIIVGDRVSAAKEYADVLTIVGQITEPVDFSGAFICLPEEDVVASITEVAVEFPNLPDDVEMELVDYAPFTINAVIDGEYVSVTYSSVRVEGNRVITNVYDATESGTYTIMFWENAVKVGTQMNNERITKVVTVQNVEDGIKAIFGDAAVFTVYDLNGHLLVKEGNVEDINNLANGIYVINGKKVNLRK